MSNSALTFVLGLAIGMALTGIYSMNDTLPGWRINKITGAQRVCSTMTGEAKCIEIP